MFSALIVDDEDKVRETLIHMLSVYCPNIRVIGQANSIASGYTQITELKPDVVFLDVKMPDGSCFDLLKKFKKVDFYFIVISAYEEYAIQSFKVNALDYLLKPIDATDLINAIVKFTRTISSEEANLKMNTLISSSDEDKDDSKKIVLKTLEGVFIVNTDDVIRCESQNNYTIFHLKDKSTILVSKTLKEYDELLAPLSFIRCHQTHLVNIKYIIRYVKHPNTILQMADGSNIPISVRKKEAVEKLFKK